MTATYDVESIVLTLDVGRGPTLRCEPSANAATWVEVDAGVERLRTASLPSTSTVGSRSTVTSTLTPTVVTMIRGTARTAPGAGLLAGVVLSRSDGAAPGAVADHGRRARADEPQATEADPDAPSLPTN